MARRRLKERKAASAAATVSATQEEGKNLGGAPLGNQNAFKGKLWREAINRALAKRCKGDMVKALDDLAEKYLKAVASGDKDFMPGFESLGSRLDGKPVQQLQHAGPDGEPLPNTVAVTLVRADAQAHGGAGGKS